MGSDGKIHLWLEWCQNHFFGVRDLKNVFFDHGKKPLFQVAMGKVMGKITFGGNGVKITFWVSDI